MEKGEISINWVIHGSCHAVTKFISTSIATVIDHEIIIKKTLCSFIVTLMYVSRAGVYGAKRSNPKSAQPFGSAIYPQSSNCVCKSGSLLNALK